MYSSDKFFRLICCHISWRRFLFRQIRIESFANRLVVSSVFIVPQIISRVEQRPSGSLVEYFYSLRRYSPFEHVRRWYVVVTTARNRFDSFAVYYPNARP